MPDLENDMDELFKKAGEHYKLKAAKSDWENIAPKLTGNNINTALANKKSNNSKYRKVLLFTLLVLFTGSILIQKIENKNMPGDLQKHLQAAVNTNETAPYIKDKAAIKANDKDYLKDEQGLVKKQNDYKLNKTLFSPGKISYSFINKPGFTNQKELQQQLKLNKQKGFEIINNSLTNTGNTTNGYSEYKKRNQLSNICHLSTVNCQPGEYEQQNSTAVSNIKKKHGFYLGAAIGASFNQVKKQGFTKPGFTAGIIAGYRLSDRASVESGLLFSKKYYYTKGKYFSMLKLRSSMPVEMQIVSVNGSTSVFEIPVRFKYQLVQNKAASLYTAAGISSYILTKEKNNYVTMLRGVQQKMTGIYKKSAVYYAASVDISIGAEFKAGRSMVRIEPYVQAPLKGVGVGSLLVSGAGLHIGITKNFR